MALRRYEEKLKNIGIREFYYFSEIQIRTNFCYIVVNESTSLFPKILTLYHKIDFEKGGFLNISHGLYQVGIVTNEKYKEQLLDLLTLEDIVHELSNVVIISLTYNKDCTFTPGVLYDVIRFLTWENINLLNILHTPMNLFLLINEKDTTRSYHILNELIKKNRKKK